jgi:biopolymer transport protein ExbD
MLVVIVIFMPQTVTMFLDEEVKVDVDKVQIEAPVHSQPAPSNDNLDELFKSDSASEPTR